MIKSFFEWDPKKRVDSFSDIYDRYVKDNFKMKQLLTKRKRDRATKPRKIAFDFLDKNEHA